MGLLMLEGFEIDRDGSLQQYKHGFATIAISAQGTGRFGWGSYGGGGNGQYITRVFPAAHDTLIMGAAVWQGDTDASTIFETQLDGNPQMGLYYRGSSLQYFDVRRNGISGNVLATISSYILPTQTWLYLEFKVTHHNSTGSFEVRVNGIPIATGTGLDTVEEGSPNRVRFDLQQRYDDIYVCNDAGSQWNDFQGEIAIEGILPNGAGTHTDHTPSPAVANYLNVDENGDHDDDTTYNWSVVAGHKDTFTKPAITQAGGTVLGACVTGWARKDDAGPRTARAMLRSGATEQTGDTEILSNTTTHLELFAEVDPNTAAAWTESNFNSAEIGYETVS